MKTKSFFNKFFLTITLVSAIIFTSCTNEGEFTTEGSDILQAVVVKPEFANGQTLYAGQTIPVGKVVVNIVDNNLTVTYNILADGWELTEAQMWVGTSKEGYPQARNGNPKIGNFPYNAGNITGLKTYTFTKPISEFGITDVNNCADFSLFFVTHASVRKLDAAGVVLQTETAWGAGYNLVEKGSWATGFQIDFKCVTEQLQVSNSCETAFAFGGVNNCFLDIDENGDGKGDFNRWGWFIGPLNLGTTTHDIYAGAGQCNTTKGTKVGTLTITYSGSTVDVVFNINAPYAMDETQVYVGNEILPRNNGEFTVAPGQYGNIHDLTNVRTDSYRITNVSGPIYVVAHAVVCGF